MTLKERMAKVEVKVSALCKHFIGLDEKIDQILTNDLPHIQKSLAVLAVKVGIGAFAGALLATVLVNFFFRGR